MPELPSSSNGDDSILGEPPGLVLPSDRPRPRPLLRSYDSSGSSDVDNGELRKLSAEPQEQLLLAKEDRRERRRESSFWQEIRTKPLKLPKDVVLLQGPFRSRSDGTFPSSAYPCQFCRRTEENQKWEKEKYEAAASEPEAWKKAIRRGGYYGDNSTLRKLMYRTCIKCGHWNDAGQTNVVPKSIAETVYMMMQGPYGP